MRRILFSLTAALLFFCFVGEVALGQAALPMPRHYVEDYANVINSSDEQSLNGVLQELEQKTGAQYIVLTVETTGGVPIEDFAIGLAEKWKLGQKGKDNGMLFVLAKNDRKYRFEVGYGLEGFITDQYCGTVGRDVLVPYLKRGDYGGGIYQANLQVVQKIADASGITLTALHKLSPQKKENQYKQGGVLFLCSCALILFGVVSYSILHKRTTTYKTQKAKGEAEEKFQDTKRKTEEEKRQQQEKERRSEEEFRRREEAHREDDRYRAEKEQNHREENERTRSEESGKRELFKDERYYGSILGLNGRIDPEQVKHRYRELAVQYHPDKVHQLGPKLKEIAEQEMKKINEAYDYFKKKYGLK